MTCRNKCLHNSLQRLPSLTKMFQKLDIEQPTIGIIYIKMARRKKGFS